MSRRYRTTTGSVPRVGLSVSPSDGWSVGEGSRVCLVKNEDSPATTEIFLYTYPDSSFHPGYLWRPVYYDRKFPLVSPGNRLPGLLRQWFFTFCLGTTPVSLLNYRSCVRTRLTLLIDTHSPPIRDLYKVHKIHISE